MKRIGILGSTGSIGRSTLSVIESHPDRFQLVTMAAGANVEAALEQARRWKPRVLSLASEQDADRIGIELKAEGLGAIEIVHGQAGTVRVATHKEVDFVVSAIVGVAGLKATYEGVRARKQVGLAKYSQSRPTDRAEYSRHRPGFALRLVLLQLADRLRRRADIGIS